MPVLQQLRHHPIARGRTLWTGSRAWQADLEHLMADLRGASSPAVLWHGLACDGSEWGLPICWASASCVDYKPNKVVGLRLSDVSTCGEVAGIANAMGMSTKEAQDALANLVDLAANSVKVAVQGEVGISLMPLLQPDGTYAVELTAVCSYAMPAAGWLLVFALQCDAGACVTLKELISIAMPHPDHDNRRDQTLAKVRAWAEPCLSKVVSPETSALMQSVMAARAGSRISGMQTPTMRFLFAVVRHGERADFDLDSSFAMGADHWPHDPPLTETGTAQAKVLANRLLCACEVSHSTFNIIVSSPYRRCVMTALEICQQLPNAMLVIDRSLGEVYSPAALANCGGREPLWVTRPPQQVFEDCGAVKHGSRFVGRWPAFPETRQSAKARYTAAFLSYINQAMRRHSNFVFVTHAVCVETALQLLAGDHMIKCVDYCSSLIVTDTATLIEQGADVKSSHPALAGNGSVNPMVTLQTDGIAVIKQDSTIGIIGREALIASSGCSARDASRLLDFAANYTRVLDSSNSKHRRRRQRLLAMKRNSWGPGAEEPVRRVSTGSLSVPPSSSDFPSSSPALPASPASPRRAIAKKARRATKLDLSANPLMRRRSV
eukprot:NODE_1643_length_2411_cov_8.063047.p1 GENE.NODE_1643_length_2411_cov_8.063047~~NODE_1643_length_2411_cov_8.063047.p1  ORF type:complete len:607 (-),score=70.88 NODE_1643_length_2411_cov_8.063047:516-2336(-)